MDNSSPTGNRLAIRFFNISGHRRNYSHSTGYCGNNGNLQITNWKKNVIKSLTRFFLSD